MTDSARMFEVVSSCEKNAEKVKSVKFEVRWSAEALMFLEGRKSRGDVMIDRLVFNKDMITDM